jgi:predicted enzyme related to lactoylglutathione lyase
MTRHVLTILAVQNLEVATRFYRQAFQWTQHVSAPLYVEFELPGGMRLGLYERTGFSRNTGQMPSTVAAGEISATELYFHTDDIPESIRRIRGAGGRELSPLARRDWGDEAAYFADPDGNVIVLAQKIEA